jgi:arylsulfatase
MKDFASNFVAAAGDPDVVEKTMKGMKVGSKTFKVHLDGYNLIPFLKVK